MAKLKEDAPFRSVTDVGPGDYVKVGSEWKQIASNSAAGSERTPREWTVTTRDGGSYGMWNIKRYAKKGDLDR
jgi:hypothetical protein